MSSAASYDGIRQVNSFYHSVIEEVTASLQSLFESEKEEEAARLRKELENKLKVKKSRAEEGGKGKRGRKGKSAPTLTAEDKAEIKELEMALKKPPAKLFDPSTLVTDLRHSWHQKLRVETEAQKRAAKAKTVNVEPAVKSVDKVDLLILVENFSI